MSEHAQAPAGVHEILAEVRRRIAAVARGSTADGQPDFRSLPAEVREKEVPASARRYFALTIQLILENREATEAELEPLRQRAAQRAEDDVPLALVLHNWHRSAQLFWDACVAASTRRSAADLSYIASALLRIQEQYHCQLVTAYEVERTALASEARNATRLVARLLLSGQEAYHEAERNAIELDDRYFVAAVSIDSLPDESTEQPTGRAVAGQRKLRRAHQVLDTVGSPPVLSSLDPNGGHILIPATTARSSGAIDELIARVETTTRAPTRAAVVEADTPGEIHESSAVASEILDLVRRQDLGPGTYRLGDVALTYQLTRPSAGYAHLEEALAPLESHPDLVLTLRTYFDRDLDRGATARALHVHPNTVNNRFNKIVEITGLDPTSFQGITTLGAALAARRAGQGR